MRWYADNSELNGLKGAEIPDILVFGGLIVSKQADRQLQSDLRKLKKGYGYSSAVVKWNMKDLRDEYLNAGRSELYEALLETSRAWRLEVFGYLAAVECRLLVACIQGHSSKRDVLKNTKERLTRYVFSNALMRYGLEAGKVISETAEVVLDWPDKGLYQPFVSEYTSAYAYGRTADDQFEYQSGPLSALNFADSVMFATMQTSSMLQIADLVVGATREFLECCLKKKSGGQGLDCLRLVRDKFCGAPDNIVQRGLVIAPAKAGFRQMVEAGVRELLYAV